MEIRSYRNVFALERRIYRIDNVRLNPAGVPVRGIVYFLGLAVCALAGSRLPLLRVMAGALPWYMRYIGLPGLLAALLTIIKIEGRPAHIAGLALLRYATGPRELSGCRPRSSSDRRFALQELLVLADGSDARLRRLRYTGPGAVLVSVAHMRVEWGSGLWRRLSRSPDITVVAAPGRHAPRRAQVIAIGPGARLSVDAAKGASSVSRPIRLDSTRPRASES